MCSLITLILLCLAWELVLAPLRPGGSFLVLKAVLLLLPLMGVLRQRVYTYQWSSMFILAFFAEGVMRAWSDSGLSQTLALVEVLLTVCYFGSVVLFVRAVRLRQA
ncbi:DUF2069 domain-containing protein [Vogesella fluminis]|uniref:DUF2069 domain-containing protein n=1 Tax=Vogesella fluminis TaxID=1069161 RepID=UPI00363F2286